MMSDFESGAKAMFDYFLNAAANTDRFNKQEILREYAEDALEYVSSETCDKWCDIQYSKAENLSLRKQLETLKKQVNDLQRERDELSNMAHLGQRN